MAEPTPVKVSSWGPARIEMVALVRSGLTAVRFPSAM